MATQYHVYANDGAGGPVDYTTPVATTALLTWTSGVLAANSDTTFAVRAYDTVSTLEEENVDARVRVIIDGSSVERSSPPPAPQAVMAQAVEGGDVTVRWVWFKGEKYQATGFKVWATVGTSVNYAVAANATLTGTYGAAELDLYTTLSGLTSGTQYAIGVKATNTSGESDASETVLVTPNATAPGSGTAASFSGTAID